MDFKFFHGVVGSGKSAAAVHQIRVIRSYGWPVEAFTASSRTPGRISSRNGEFEHAHDVELLTASFAGGAAEFVIVDEAQFLTTDQVSALQYLVRNLGVTVCCYGLLTDYLNRVFPGARALIEAGATTVAMPDVPCGRCEDRPARVNARMFGTRVVRDGPVEDVGARYVPMCLSCWGGR